MRKFERYFTVVVILVAVFASLSCSIGVGGADQKATDTPSASTAGKVTATTTASTAPAEVTRTAPAAKTVIPAQVPTLAPNKPAPTLGALSDLAASTGTFDSYSMALVYHAEGKDEQGKPYKQDFTFAEDSIKSQKADHFKISGMSALLGLGSGDLDIYQLNSSLYMYSAPRNGQNASCLALGGDATTFDPTTMNPAAMMKNITVDKLIEKGAMVNGTMTDHYTLKNNDMGFGEATSQSGEVWLAQDGCYPVKFTGQADGTFDVTAKFTGTITWTYDVTNVNKLTGIDLPAECSSQGSAQSDLPIPPNATGLSQLGKMTVFSSPDKPGDVSTYFQKTLVEKGWTVDSVDESAGSTITLNISKTGQKMQILITGDSSIGGSNVIISPVL